MLAQTFQTWWLYQHVPMMVFVFCFGACVGSFLNVVIYRLPAGMSVTTPPSRCPTCGARLKFFRENLPIIGWFLVRGRCRYCGVKISPQYMVIELIMACTFLGLYVLLYCTSPSTQWWGQVGGSWWYINSWRTWPVFTAWVFLVAGLCAMTIIDARTFTIPIQIPLFVTFTAFIAYPLQALLPLVPTPAHQWAIPAMCWPGVCMSIGGMLGVLLSCLLLKTGRMKYSFADYVDFLPPQHAQAPPSTDNVTVFEGVFLVSLMVALLAVGFVGLWPAIALGLATGLLIVLISRARGVSFGAESHPTGEQVLAPDYPHARREMLVELKFLLPCLAGLIAGYAIARTLPVAPPPVVLQALGGSLAGYLVGGGLIWGIRILGTLAFGREAMGMGDVHLLGAVGAVLGWFDPILIFFIAPFSALLWTVVSIGLASVFRGVQRVLPYGPHLAVATLLVMLLRPGVNQVWSMIMPTVPRPAGGLCTPSAGSDSAGLMQREWIGLVRNQSPQGAMTGLDSPKRLGSNPAAHRSSLGALRMRTALSQRSVDAENGTQKGCTCHGNRKDDDAGPAAGGPGDDWMQEQPQGGKRQADCRQ